MSDSRRTARSLCSSRSVVVMWGRFPGALQVAVAGCGCVAVAIAVADADGDCSGD